MNANTFTGNGVTLDNTGFQPQNQNPTNTNNPFHNNNNNNNQAPTSTNPMGGGQLANPKGGSFGERRHLHLQQRKTEQPKAYGGFQPAGRLLDNQENPRNNGTAGNFLPPTAAGNQFGGNGVNQTTLADNQNVMNYAGGAQNQTSTGGTNWLGANSKNHTDVSFGKSRRGGGWYEIKTHDGVSNGSLATNCSSEGDTGSLGFLGNGPHLNSFQKNLVVASDLPVVNGANQVFTTTVRNDPALQKQFLTNFQLRLKDLDLMVTSLLSY